MLNLRRFGEPREPWDSVDRSPASVFVWSSRPVRCIPGLACWTGRPVASTWHNQRRHRGLASGSFCGDLPASEAPRATS